MKPRRGDYVTVIHKNNPLNRLTGIVEYVKYSGNQIDPYNTFKLNISEELEIDAYKITSAGIPDNIPLKFLFEDRVYVGMSDGSAFSGVSLDDGRHLWADVVDRWEVIM